MMYFSSLGIGCRYRFLSLAGDLHAREKASIAVFTPPSFPRRRESTALLASHLDSRLRGNDNSLGNDNFLSGWAIFLPFTGEGCRHCTSEVRRPFRLAPLHAEPSTAQRLVLPKERDRLAVAALLQRYQERCRLTS